MKNDASLRSLLLLKRKSIGLQDPKIAGKCENIFGIKYLTKVNWDLYLEQF